MSKISLIIEREYITRVKKKTFIIMTILGPILIAALWIVPIYVTTLSQGKKKPSRFLMKRDCFSINFNPTSIFDLFLSSPIWKPLKKD